MIANGPSFNAAFSLSATDSDADTDTPETGNPIAPDAGGVDNIVETIMASKMIDSEGKPLANVIAARQSTAWLVADGHVSLAQMRMLDRFLTTRGDVYRAQVIGYFDEGGPVSRIEVVIDASQKPPKIIFQRDLTNLGKGFTPRQLGPVGR